MATISTTTYHESGLQVTLPNGEHFRFATLPSYIPLKGQHLKEMDFAWIHQNKLIILEVKDFSGIAVLPYQKLLDNLINKVTDSLMMLLSGWSSGAWGSAFAPQLPIAAQAPVPLILAVALDLPADLHVHLSALRTALNARLKGRLQLANVQSIALMDYMTLRRNSLFSQYIR